MQLWEALFGRSITPAERLRQHLHALQRARRELDRERSKLEVQEKQLVTSIKQNARKGQMVCQILTRARVKSWPATLFALGVTYTSSTR